MARSVAILGAGQIGYATAKMFHFAGWDVRILARTKPAWLTADIAFERHVIGEDQTDWGDAIVDTIAFDEEDIARYDPDKIGRLVAISSASVYCDNHGRTLDEGIAKGYPEFEGAITEEQATVAPGPDTYSTRKIRMENKARELFGARATILRPCAIYGPQSRHPREWWFVKRLLDGRSHIPLLMDGQSQFQTTDVDCIAAISLKAAQEGLSGAYNVADGDAPSVREIGVAIAHVLDKQVEFIDSGLTGFVGRTPWSLPLPFMVSAAKAASATGNKRAAFADRISSAVEWLAGRNPIDWRTAFPQLAAYPWDLFDYAAEDRFFDEQH